MINHFERIAGGNFGDDLNETMWDRLLPKPLSQYLDEETFFIGIGTRLRPKNIPKGKKIIVFGAGFGYSETAPIVDKNWDIRCLRGPLTADALRIDQSKVITDSAILCKDLYSKGKPRFKVSFIPHHLTLSEDDWKEVCDRAKFNLINPCNNPDIVIDQIIHSELVIAESLHAAIIADTFRIPWIPVKTRNTFSEFKWNDWGKSLGLEMVFNKITPLYNVKVRNRTSFFKRLIKTIYGKSVSTIVAEKHLREVVKRPSYLSDNFIFHEKYNDIRNCLDKFIQDLEKR